MVYIHGGAWIIGDKREQGKPMMYELVARGWVCVAINYRLSPKATWPDHIVDAKRAVAWVKEHIAEYGGDPAFVAISGGSAGGHLCALLALTAGDPAFQPGFEEADTSVQACVPFYGVMDMTGSPEGSGRFGPACSRCSRRRVMKIKDSEHPEVFGDASPTHRVHAGAPPFFVLQGVNDTLVPVEVARIFVDRLRAVSSAAGGLRRAAPGPARLRRPGLAALPGHDVGRGRLPRGRPRAHRSGYRTSTGAQRPRHLSDAERATEV